MTEQRWLAIRDLKEVPRDVWFEYYREKGGVLDAENFWRMFQEVLCTASVVRNSKGNLVKMDFNTALNRLYNHYNEKFQC